MSILSRVIEAGKTGVTKGNVIVGIVTLSVGVGIPVGNQFPDRFQVLEVPFQV